MIGLCGGVVVFVSLAHHHHVVTATEWVGVHLDGVEVGVRVTALSLIGGAPVIIPDWQILDTFRSFVQSLGFATQTLSSSVNPDVESLHSEEQDEVFQAPTVRLL